MVTVVLVVACAGMTCWLVFNGVTVVSDHRVSDGGSRDRTRTTGSVVGAHQTNTLAILSLVFGVLGGLVAIPLGHIALSQIKRTGESGRGLAIAGLVLGYVMVAAVIALALAVSAASGS